MKSTDAPGKQAVPFGTNGPREAITATTPSGSNQASYDQGFPPITMTLKSAGGLPPKGQDMNQILFELSNIGRYLSAGGGYVYDSAFSTAVGGYPVSAIIPNSTGTGYWLNTIEDNKANPENLTAALTGWVPVGSYGTSTITALSSASITLSTLQASKERIILSGALTANINIVVPAWVKSWTVVNNCTGNFSVTVKTSSGSGVAIPAGSTRRVYGDGVNVSFDLGSSAFRDVGTGTNQIPDMSSFIFNRSGTGVGNRKMTLQLPNGFILKVVNGTADSNGYFYQAFDQPFPNALLFAWATERAPNGNLTQSSTVNASMEYSNLSYGAAQMRSLTSGSNISALSGSVSFFAIGY